jgi:hypothetical protein
MPVNRPYSSYAACLPRRSEAKAGVLERGGPTRACDAAFACFYRSTASRLLKASKAYSRLLKVKITIIFYFLERSFRSARPPSNRSSTNPCARFGRLRKAKSGKVRLSQAKYPFSGKKRLFNFSAVKASQAGSRPVKAVLKKIFFPIQSILSFCQKLRKNFVPGHFSLNYSRTQ